MSDDHAYILAGVGKPDNHPVRIMFEIRVKGFGGVGGGVAFGPSVESITQTDVLGAFTGSRRGLLCQRPLASHEGGCQQWCWMVRCINNYGEIHSGSGKNEGTEDKTRKTTNGLSLNTAKHNSVIPPIHLLRAVSQRKGIRGTVYETASIGMKYSASFFWPTGPLLLLSFAPKSS